MTRCRSTRALSLTATVLAAFVSSCGTTGGSRPSPSASLDLKVGNLARGQSLHLSGRVTDVRPEHTCLSVSGVNICATTIAPHPASEFPETPRPVLREGEYVSGDLERGEFAGHSNLLSWVFVGTIHGS